MEDIERKIERTNRESSDEDSEEDEGSLEDDDSSENEELVREEGVISKNTRDDMIIEEWKESTEAIIIESLNKAIFKKGNMAKSQEEEQRKDKRESIVNEDDNTVKITNDNDNEALLSRCTIKIAFNRTDTNLAPCIKTMSDILTFAIIRR